jgi:hypothetical protein
MNMQGMNAALAALAEGMMFRDVIFSFTGCKYWTCAHSLQSSLSLRKQVTAKHRRSSLSALKT